MSEIDKIFAEREARRQEKERERRERFEVAAQFLRDLYERDITPSKALSENGITASYSNERVLLHRADAGIYADAFQIAVGQDGAIDIAGRSLGVFDPDAKVQLRLDIITEMLTYFDL